MRANSAIVQANVKKIPQAACGTLWNLSAGPPFIPGSRQSALMAPLLPANADRTGPRRAPDQNLLQPNRHRTVRIQKLNRMILKGELSNFLCSQMPFLAMKNVHNIRCLRCLVNETVAAAPPSPLARISGTDFWPRSCSVKVKGCQGSERW